MHSEQVEVERLLLAQVAKGNEAAFRQIFDSYRDRVYAYAFRFLKSKEQSEEIVQEIFLRLWMLREQLDEVRNLGGYLRTITNRLTLDALRKKAIAFKAQSGKLANWTDVDAHTMDQIILRNSEEYMSLAIERLPAQQKLVYRMYYIEGLKQKDIADKLNISPLTVKVHLREAIKTLKGYLKEGGSLPILVFAFLGLIK